MTPELTAARDGAIERFVQREYADETYDASYESGIIRKAWADAEPKFVIQCDGDTEPHVYVGDDGYYYIDIVVNDEAIHCVQLDTRDPRTVAEGWMSVYLQNWYSTRAQPTHKHPSEPDDIFADDDWAIDPNMGAQG